MQDENRAVKLGEPWPNPAVLADRSELHPVAHPGGGPAIRTLMSARTADLGVLLA